MTKYMSPSCYELVSEQVRRTPDAVAVVLDNSSLSYAQLDASAEVLARRIARSARASDAIIGVLLPRSADMIISYLAVLKAGCGYLPLDPGLPEQRIRMMLEDGCASVLVTSAACAERLDSHVGLRLLLLDEPRPSAAEIMELPVVSPDNIAYVIYTSGSTGRPKGVLVPHRGLCNLIAWHHDQLGLRAGMRTSQVASVMFDAAAWEIWAALTVGATLVICSNVAELSSDELAEWLRRNEVNSTFLPTPLAEQLMLAQQNKPLSSLRLLLTGGDQLRQRPTPALPYEVRNNYGPTEITVVATSAVIDGQSSVPPIGKPIANTKTYLLDEWLQPVPVGVRGEIYIAGVGLARGYANQPTLTAERFVPDPFGLPGTRMYRTGDLARWRSDGNLEFVGRSDKQVKIRGYRIELAEVESVLLGHYAVKEAVVLARESANGDKRLVAYVTMRAGRGVEMEVLRRHLKDILPIYMVPAAFVYLESLPLTRNGKVDRESLPTPECEHVSTSYVPAVGEVEETLASVWSELLQVSQVGRFDNFFELGGHSLHGVKLAAIVSRRFGISMPLVTIFKCPTIHEIAGVITRLVNVGGKHPLDTSALEEGAI